MIATMSDKKKEKDDKRAAALRENLRRRKGATKPVAKKDTAKK